MKFEQTALTSIDSYKLGHAAQYPAGTTKVYSNFTARSNKHFKQATSNHIVWFGLQAFLEELNSIWQTTFFDKPIENIAKEFQELVAPFCGANAFDVSKIEALHKLGYLPLEIKALPEGTLVNIGVPVLTITNTVPEAYWLPNFLETCMSSELWKASTSATISYTYRKLIDKYADITAGSSEFVMWQGHDFSPRGMSGMQDAAKSGAGHLLSFTGSDNIPALKLVNDVYAGKNTFIAGSVPATEHSVMCAGGKENEVETFRRLLKTYPAGVLSIVSDTWDFWNVITNTAQELKQEILDRKPDSLGLSKVVFRPDSGDPVEIICGDEIPVVDSVAEAVDHLVEEEQTKTPHGEQGSNEVQGIFMLDGKYMQVVVSIFWNRYDKQYYYVDEYKLESVKEVQLTPEQKGAVQCLAEIFGTTTNAKGYKTLNSKVGLIYGDSITIERAEQILQRLADKGYASDNIVFGIGSYTFQYNTRDTFGFAMKATYVEINGEGVAIFKDPKTDDGVKKSAKGLLKVEGFNGNYRLVNDCNKQEEQEGCLQTVFLNGVITRKQDFATIRSNLGVL